VKRFYFVVILLLIISNLFAESMFLDTSYFYNILETSYTYVRMINNDYFIAFSFNRNDSNITSKIYLKDYYKLNLKLEKHFYKSETKTTIQHDCYYYIIGKGFVIPIEKYYPYNWNTNKLDSQSLINVDVSMLENTLDASSYSYSKWKQYKKQYKYNSADTDKGTEGWARVLFFDSGIKRITASSFLTEKTKNGLIDYIPENLLERLYYMTGPDRDILSFDTITPPWVEGKDDYGINEYLDIEFKWKSDEIQILNGFVDFTRIDLYEKNSRVKTILIESKNPDFIKEYNLEDIVKYNVIKLPEKTDKIRIIIKDIYPGTKYKDTSLSSIIVTNPNFASYEDIMESITKKLDEGIIDARFDKNEPLPSKIKVIK